LSRKTDKMKDPLQPPVTPPLTQSDLAQPRDPESLSTVVTRGDRRQSLQALRDRLAEEANDTRWARHKSECHCVCGMGDGRLMVAIARELRAVIAELDGLPVSEGASALDLNAARVADELAAARARRESAS